MLSKSHCSFVFINRCEIIMHYTNDKETILYIKEIKKNNFIGTGLKLGGGKIKMNTTHVMVYFSLFGNQFPIDCVTEILEIKPTNTYQKGDGIVRPHNSNVSSTKTHYRKETVWEVSTDYQESNDVNEQLDQILKLLKNKANIINRLKVDYHLECRFSIVIIIENGYTPSFQLTNEQITFANSINAEFDIDLYANPYDDTFKD